MVKKLVTTKGQKPTLEQLREVEEAKKYPIEFDEDCQELSPDLMKAFKNARIQQNRHKNAQRYMIFTEDYCDEELKGIVVERKPKTER